MIVDWSTGRAEGNIFSMRMLGGGGACFEYGVIEYAIE
jgi:hypothetical protein